MLRKKLKFIHIPKCAGTTIEDNAEKIGILWGKNDLILKHCCNGVKGACFWHLPLRFIPKYKLTCLLERYNLFCVVRNPYDRCLSEFHYFLSLGKVNINSRNHDDTNGKKHTNNNIKNKTGNKPNNELDNELDDNDVDNTVTPDILNKTICSYIRKGKRKDHWAPQSTFVYDSDGYTPIIKNIIYFEKLEEQFNSLMNEYQLNIRLETISNVSEKLFTIRDLYPTTILCINKFYHNDFINFGYTML